MVEKSFKTQSKLSLAVFFLFLCVLQPSPASATDPGEKWVQAETEHFLLIFKEKNKAAASEILSFVEDVYNQVTAFFDDSYPRKVHVILSDKEDSFNAYYSSYPDMIRLFLAPPTGTTETIKGRRGHLYSVFAHEFTHYIHLTSSKKLSGVAKILFGPSYRSYINSIYLPRWATEGIAVKLETLFTTAGRGRDPLWELLYKAPALEGSIPSMGKAANFFRGHSRPYVFGYLFVNHLMENYGRDAFERINNHYVGFHSLALAVRKAIGKSIPELHEEMVKTLEERYREDALLPPRKSLTPSGEDWTMPVATHSSWYLIRRRSDTKSDAVLKWDKRAGRHKEIFTSANIYSLAAAYDEDYLILVSSDGDLYRLEDKKLSRVTKNKLLAQPTLSSDGGRLAAIELLKESSSTRLVSIDQASGELSILYEKEGALILHPSLSPSGKQIAFFMNAGGFRDLYVLNLEEKESSPHPLVGPDTSGEFFPHFVDENRLLFSSAREGALKLYMADLKTGQFFRVAEDRVGISQGDFQKDGKVLYRTYSSFHYQVKEALPNFEEVFFFTDTGKGEPPDASPYPEITIEPYQMKFPALVYWEPTFGLIGKISDEGQWDVGPTFSLITGGRNYLETAVVDIETTYTPAFLLKNHKIFVQPSVTFFPIKEKKQALSIGGSISSSTIFPSKEKVDGTASVKSSLLPALKISYSRKDGRPDIYVKNRIAVKFGPNIRFGSTSQNARMSLDSIFSYAFTLGRDDGGFRLSKNYRGPYLRAQGDFKLGYPFEESLSRPLVAVKGGLSGAIPFVRAQSLHPYFGIRWNNREIAFREGFAPGNRYKLPLFQNTLVSHAGKAIGAIPAHVSFYTTLDYDIPLWIVDAAFPPMMSLNRVSASLHAGHWSAISREFKVKTPGKTSSPKYKTLLSEGLLLQQLFVGGSLTFDFYFNRTSIPLKFSYRHRVYSSLGGWKPDESSPWSFSLTVSGPPIPFLG